MLTRLGGWGGGMGPVFFLGGVIVRLGGEGSVLKLRQWEFVI